jgi:ATP-dependent helicase/nuclease subunit B
MPNPPDSAKGEAWPTLTVNSRLARWRLLEYNKAQNQSGLKAWSTPQILPLTAWLKQVWMQSLPEQYILTTLQAEKLWAKIVRQSSWKIKLDLLHLREASKNAQEAYSLIQQYRLPVDHENYSRTEEGNLFFRWVHTYKEWLLTHNALDPASVLDAVHSAMNKGKIPLPKGIVFAGFEEVTPQFQEWLDFLKNKNIDFKFDPEITPTKTITLPVAGKNIEVREYNNKAEETIQCARWVRAQFQTGKTFGIVVPDLQAYRSILNRELAAELTPESAFPWIDKERPFNFSLGTPLAEESMINIALLLLSIKTNTVPLQIFTAIIKSTFFISGQKESSQVHELEMTLLKKNIIEVPLANVLKYFNSEFSEHLTDLIQKWKSFIENRQQKKLPGQWGLEIAQFLKSIGWPNSDNTLSEKEFQIYESWKECLDKLASLDIVLGERTLRQVMETLTAIVQEHPFQEKTSEAPIQVLGLLESSGMRFDHIWVMGCHAEALPALPTPNPFLPVETRKQFNLPHSTARRELEFALNSVRRLIAATPNIIFSHPAMDKITELKVSPLLLPLKDSNQKTSKDIIIPGSYSHRIKDQGFLKEPLEVFKESVTIPATKEERSAYTTKGPGGGYGLFKDQAECPFRSFANHRLQTQTTEFPELDFDHRERGIIVHQALEYFWKETQSRKGLLDLSDQNTLQGKIESAVNKALSHQDGRLKKQPRFIALEKVRIVDLLLQWLRMEMQRTEFEVVHQEKKISFFVSKISLSLRIDRIDRTPDGNSLLIDYKTGNIQTGDWFSDRIKEPQLPLYALQHSPNAILFGQVKKGSLRFKGAIDPAVKDTGLKPITFKKITELTECTGWNELLHYWKRKLTALADQFLSGQTEVDPVNGIPTCRNCGLQTLCRIQKTDMEVPDEDKA